jgi:uncharacterized membrane protein YdjX (TVP38/TMEM64 family)
MADQMLILLVTILVSLFIGEAIISTFNLPELTIAIFVLLGAAVAYFATRKKKSDAVSL